MNTYKGPNVSYTPMAQENNDAGQEGLDSLNPGNVNEMGNGVPLGSVDYSRQGNTYYNMPDTQNWSRQERMPFFKQLFISFVPPLYAKYKGISKTATKSFVKSFMLLLLLIAYINVGISFFAGGKDGTGILSGILDFKIENGELSLEDEILYKDEAKGSVIYANDEIASFTYDDLDYYIKEGYNEVLLISRTNGIILRGGMMVRSFKWSQVTAKVIDKKWMIAKAMPVLIVGLFLFTFVAVFISALFYRFVAWLFSLVGKLIALVERKSITSLNMSKVAVYALVPGMVLRTVVRFIPASIALAISPYLVIAYLLLPIIIMAIAIPFME